MKLTENADERYMKMLDPDVQHHLSTLLSGASATLMDGVMNWGFEVVKHLSVINAAGIAGATALYGSSPFKPALLVAVYWFLAGLVIAVLSMVSIYICGVLFQRAYTKSIFAVLCNVDPLVRLRPPRWSSWWIGVNWTIVGLSIGAFIVGVLKVVLNVRPC